MMLRRTFLRMLVAGLAMAPVAAEAFHIDHVMQRRKKKTALTQKPKRTKVVKPKRPAYKGREDVSFYSFEKPGTIIIKTKERALYRVLGGGKATRYLVAVGKEGFSWAGVAKIAMKREKPTWTPPPEMIARTPKYAKWAGGMPGGLPENPLGAAALYLYKGKIDTGFRIHGTIVPSSIGTAASSGCIRMLNHEVLELFALTRIGTKVIVI